MIFRDKTKSKRWKTDKNETKKGNVDCRSQPTFRWSCWTAKISTLYKRRTKRVEPTRALFQIHIITRCAHWSVRGTGISLLSSFFCHLCILVRGTSFFDKKRKKKRNAEWGLWVNIVQVFRSGGRGWRENLGDRDPWAQRSPLQCIIEAFYHLTIVDF